jgi:palmitoyltransferase ZDHHC6
MKFSCLVCGVWIFIGLLMTSHVYVNIWPYKEHFLTSWWGLTKLCAFVFLLVNLLTNYWLAIRTEPGHVPLDWKPSGMSDVELARCRKESIARGRGKSHSLKARWCGVCKHWKPPRTHHCSDCQTCVLKMDHHWYELKSETELNFVKATKKKRLTMISVA